MKEPAQHFAATRSSGTGGGTIFLGQPAQLQNSSPDQPINCMYLRPTAIQPASARHSPFIFPYFRQFPPCQRPAATHQQLHQLPAECNSFQFHHVQLHAQTCSLSMPPLLVSSCSLRLSSCWQETPNFTMERGDGARTNAHQRLMKEPAQHFAATRSSGTGGGTIFLGQPAQLQNSSPNQPINCMYLRPTAIQPASARHLPFIFPYFRQFPPCHRPAATYQQLHQLPAECNSFQFHHVQLHAQTCSTCQCLHWSTAGLITQPSSVIVLAGKPKPHDGKGD